MSDEKKIDLNRLAGLIDDVLREIIACKTMAELDEIRIKVADIMTSTKSEQEFLKIQSTFIKQRKKVKK